MRLTIETVPPRGRKERGPMGHLVVSSEGLRLHEVYAVAHRLVSDVALSGDLFHRARKGADYVAGLIQRREVRYGITTGFASFKTVFIPPEKTAELQVNLIRSHCVGVGPVLSEDEVRAAMLVRLNSLAQGNSGVRPELLEHLIGMLNGNVYPYVPSQGSVGSSGDLAPLSHITLAMMGEGMAFVDGKLVPAAEALERAGLTPIILAAKEGLAMNNGTSVMTGIAALAVHRAVDLVKVADIAAAMTLEACSGTLWAYDERVHALRRQSGQRVAAANVRKIAGDSTLLASYDLINQVQDSYSLRCTPQVHGASRDSICHAASIVANEINAVTDNPLIFPDDNESFSAGNFHGEPVAQAMDIFAIGVAELANISERRIAKLVDKNTNEGLPANLMGNDGGLNNGFMMPQYTAAALVSENKVLSHPASVDSIPTGSNSEDHVSMGTIAARKGRDVFNNAESVLCIELIAAAQALELRRAKLDAEGKGDLDFGTGTKAALEAVRSRVEPYTHDRVFSPDFEAVRDLIRSGELLAVVEEAVGTLS